LACKYNGKVGYEPLKAIQIPNYVEFEVETKLKWEERITKMIT
jgi:phosphoribosylformylglycinamidine (FGAM) synthase PurS component